MTTSREREKEDESLRSICLVFYLLFRDADEGGNCERAAPNDTCTIEKMCSFQNFEAWMTMVHFTMGEFDVNTHTQAHNYYSFLFLSHFILVLTVRFNTLRIFS